MNSTIVKELGTKTVVAVGDSELMDTIITSSLGFFKDHAITATAILMFSILMFSFVIRIFLDKGEGSSQNMIFTGTIYVMISLGMFVAMIFLDMGVVAAQATLR